MTRIHTTLTGIVGTKPVLHIRQANGAELPVTQFRLAIVDRVRDQASQEWRDGETQWVTVSAFRSLAHNIAASIHKGERVVATGALTLNEYVTHENQARSELRLEVKHLGHDLAFGRSQFARVVRDESLSEGDPATGSDTSFGNETVTAPGATETADTGVRRAPKKSSVSSRPGSKSTTQQDPARITLVELAVSGQKSVPAVGRLSEPGINTVDSLLTSDDELVGAPF